MIPKGHMLKNASRRGHFARQSLLGSLHVKGTVGAFFLMPQYDVSSFAPCKFQDTMFCFTMGPKQWNPPKLWPRVTNFSKLRILSVCYSNRKVAHDSHQKGSCRLLSWGLTGSSVPHTLGGTIFWNVSRQIVQGPGALLLSYLCPWKEAL